MSFIGIRLHVVQMTYLNHLDKNLNTIAFITPSLAAIMYMLARSQRSKNWNHMSFIHLFIYLQGMVHDTQFYGKCFNEV